jgi:glycosyltransferase involved in cell wall biosynthesis
MPSSKPKKEKRVLLAVRYLWGDEGITAQLTAIVRELKSRGWEVGLISGIPPEEAANNEELSRLLENTTFHYASYPTDLSLSALPTSLYSILDTIRFCITYNPSVIHLFSMSLTPHFFIVRSILGLKYISRCPIKPDLEREEISLASTINTLDGSFTGDLVMAISSDMKEVMKAELNVPEERIRIILNGMDTSHFRPPSADERLSARTHFGLGEQENVICIVGRLDWIKGHDVLFDALCMLKERGYEITTLCAGTGGYEREIEELAEELGIRDSVQFLGFTEPRRVYWASDLIALPSRREGFACATAEAMLCGTVPIRTPTAGASDQIDDEETGFIVPFDAPSELARHIQYLFDHPERRRSMGRQAQRVSVERFALESSVDEIESLYTSLI